MLQQTNAYRVESVFREFVAKYPNVSVLAGSRLQDVREVLKPLGLSYRAARLKSIAVELTERYGGVVPCSEKSLITLPGIGPYITNATLCFAYSKRVPLVDTNIIRLYDRVFGFRSGRNRPREDKEVWQFAKEMLPKTGFKDYNLSLLDFAAEVCVSRQPHCDECPVTGICYYHTQCTEKNEN